MDAERSSLEAGPDIECLSRILPTARPLGDVEGFLWPLQISGSSDKYIELNALMGFALSLELVNQVFGGDEFAGLRVAAGLRLDDPQEKGFKLL